MPENLTKWRRRRIFWSTWVYFTQNSRKMTLKVEKTSNYMADMADMADIPITPLFLSPPPVSCVQGGGELKVTPGLILKLNLNLKLEG